MKKLKDIIKESSLSRIWKHVTTHDSGTITAFRNRKECGKGEKIFKKENKHNNVLLKSKLLSMGYGVTEIKGVYIENFKTPDAIAVKETSYIVVDLKDTGKLKKDLIKLGTYFNQDSITYSKPSGEYYLISTNKCPSGYPGRGTIGKEVKLGKPFFGKAGEFYSTVNGRPFVFEGINSNFINSITDFYPTEIRSIKHWANTVILD